MDKELKEANERLNDIKNSRKFDTGAIRDSSDGKPNVHDMQGYTLLRFGYHMEMGEQNYGESNFIKGIPDKAAKESLARHYAKLMDGQDDEDHCSAIIFNIQLLMLNQRERGVKSDHYFKLKTET